MKIAKRQLIRLIRESLIKEQVMWHSTAPENIEAILSQGLLVGRESAQTMGGAWADEFYGTRPIYLSVDKGKYEGTPLAVNTSGLSLVADLPSLVDTGAYQEEEGMYWDEGKEPQQMIDIVDEDGMVYFDDLLSPGSAAAQAAIEITGTAAVAQDIPSKNISEKDSDLEKISHSAAESEWASKSQADKDAHWKNAAWETMAWKRYRKYAQAEEIPFDPDNEEDMKRARAWWSDQPESKQFEGAMKITKNQLRRIIKEEHARLINEINWEEVAAELDVDPQITKVGHLRKIIKTLQSEKRAKLGIDGLKDLGIGALADIIPGAGTALSLGQTLKAMYSAPDDKKTDTMLDKLNVDDEVAAIVDDTVEDNFLDVALKSVEGLGDEEDIPDINQALANWLKSKYDARTVDGFQEGKIMRIKRSQLRRVIREAIDIVNQDTGEVIDFGGPGSLWPDEAVPDLVKRLNLNLSPNDTLSKEDWDKLFDETVGKHFDRKDKRKAEKLAADRERLNIDNLLQRLRDWAQIAADEWQADNPQGPSVEDVAYDLADSAEYTFARDEWEELLWHFDGNEDDLRIYTAESM